MAANPATLQELLRRSADNSAETTPTDYRSHLALELIADTLIALLAELQKPAKACGHVDPIAEGEKYTRGVKMSCEPAGRSRRFSRLTQSPVYAATARSLMTSGASGHVPCTADAHARIGRQRKLVPPGLVGRFLFPMRIVQNRWEQTFFIASGPIVGSGDRCRPIRNTQAGGRVERVHEKGADEDSGDYHCGQGNHHKAHLALLCFKSNVLLSQTIWPFAN